MTDEEVRDIAELLLALEEDSPMPDKMKINHLKIILERLKDEQEERTVE